MWKCFRLFLKLMNHDISNVRVTANFSIGQNLLKKNWEKINIDIINWYKQPPEVFCKKRCSQKYRQYHRKTPVLESLFNKVAGPKPYNFIEKWLKNRCFPKNIAKFLRTPILNIWERLILNWQNSFWLNRLPQII